MYNIKIQEKGTVGVHNVDRLKLETVQRFFQSIWTLQSAASIDLQSTNFVQDAFDVLTCWLLGRWMRKFSCKQNIHTQVPQILLVVSLISINNSNFMISFLYHETQRCKLLQKQCMWITVVHSFLYNKYFFKIKYIFQYFSGLLVQTHKNKSHCLNFILYFF